MCKNKTSVKYFTKVTQSSLLTLSTLCFLNIRVSLLQTKPPTSDLLPDATQATDPLIDATHHQLHLHRHQHHTLIHLLEFFFFFSIIIGPIVSWPPPPSLIHSFNLSSGFFFPLLLRVFIDFGFWMVYGSCVVGFVGYGGWFGCFVGLGGGWVVGFRWVVER